MTRRANWWDDDGPAIALDEWLDHVSRDPDLRHDGYADAPLPSGNVLRAEDPSMAVWTAWKHEGKNANHAWLWLSSNGNVMAKNPDRDMTAKMHEIAAAMGAKLQGDEGEFYDADGDMIPDDNDDAPRTWAAKFKRLWNRNS